MAGVCSGMKQIYAIGIGLIGGSLAKDIKRLDPEVVIHGISRKEATLNEALALNLIDKKATLDDIHKADLVIVSIPVDATVALLPTILEIFWPCILLQVQNSRDQVLP